MSKGANAAVLGRIALTENDPVYLYEVVLTGGLILRYAGQQDAPISFAGHTWMPAAIKHSPIDCARDLRVDEVELEFPIVSSELEAYLAAGGKMSGLQVNIYKVFRTALADPLNYIHEFGGQTDAPGYTEDAMKVRARRQAGTFEKIIPRLTYMPLCPFPFKGSPYCTYAGATETCDHTVTACQGMAGGSNIAQFGGCPWVPGVPEE